MHASDTDTANNSSSLATHLSAARIAALIAASSNAHAKAVAIEVVAQTGSTNADLLARVNRVPAPVAPVLLVAESQTAGRGRAGRAWHTTPDSALTFSLAWKFNRPVQALIGLPLAIGVALAEALHVFGLKVELKWPNDVLRDGAKLAGILIETAQTRRAGSHGTWTVIGIGINLAMPADLQTRIGRAVADVSELLSHDRERLLALLLSALSDALAEFDTYGFTAFAARWNRLHAYAGRVVRILDNDRVVHEGSAVGVDDQGCFLMDTASGRVTVVAGDVSLRLQE